MLPSETLILEDSEAVAAEVCRRIGDAAQDAIARRQVFRLVLAGGATPRRAYELLARTTQTWSAWEIFWGDERCLPADDPERNSRAAIDAWLGRVPLAPGQVHPIPAELGPALAAERYAAVIDGKRPFDLVLLGMGEDGHTASLFPGGEEGNAPVLAVQHAPKPPAERVSLGYPVLRECRRQLVMIAGSGKAGALAAWQGGADLPIARAVRPDACVVIDAGLGAIVSGWR